MAEQDCSSPSSAPKSADSTSPCLRTSTAMTTDTPATKDHIDANDVRESPDYTLTATPLQPSSCLSSKATMSVNISTDGESDNSDDVENQPDSNLLAPPRFSFPKPERSSPSSVSTATTSRADTPMTKNRVNDTDDVEDQPESVLMEPSFQKPPAEKAGVWKRLRSAKGYRFGTTLGTILAAAVLAVNLIVAAWASSKETIFKGDCYTSKWVSTGVHLVINILSTLLLGASNYAMQCLCAPTRTEVDRAHRRFVWLDIGQQSLHNLRYGKRWKLALWLLLGISSIPLHLFYNSVLYSLVGANQYYIYWVPESFVQGEPFNQTDPHRWALGDPPFGTFQGETPAAADPAKIQKDVTKFETLSNAECIGNYSHDFVSDRRNLVIVLDDMPPNNSIQYRDYDVTVPGRFGYGDPYGWICCLYADYQSTDGNHTPCASILDKIDPKNWTYTWGDLYHVRECRSEKVEPKCQLNFSLPIFGVVLCFNAFKLACIAFVAFKLYDEPLVTVGDAVASFLAAPDPSTKGMCLVPEAELLQRRRREGMTVTSPRQYRPQKTRWSKTARKHHWLATLTFFAIAVGIDLGLFIYALTSLAQVYDQTGFDSIWRLGFGATRSQTIISGWKLPTTGNSALLSAVLVANSPQVILSFIYVIFNNLCTRLTLAREWSTYAAQRKSLRVSCPAGEQRSTYFLQIPYRYGVPLMAASVLLHWLVSQSIFLVRVDVYDLLGAVVEDLAITSCGYSPLVMPLTMLVAVCLIAAAYGIAHFRRIDTGMPVVGSCSAAVSAACHAPTDDSALRPVKWGAVVVDGESGGIGHCCFSSGKVETPRCGAYYA